jgi:Carboxypeptidase regulatory-like domain
MRGMLLASLLIGLLPVWMQVFCCVARAQSSTSAILGSVFDAQGLAIPDARVVIHNTDLSLVRSLTTDGHGNFRAAGLVSGAYVVAPASRTMPSSDLTHSRTRTTGTTAQSSTVR